MTAPLTSREYGWLIALLEDAIEDIQQDESWDDELRTVEIGNARTLMEKLEELHRKPPSG